jgi:hypothetical protein
MSWIDPDSRDYEDVVGDSSYQEWDSSNDDEWGEKEDDLSSYIDIGDEEW